MSDAPPPAADLDLTPAEQRVLGALIEKEATVPDTYPMTLNGLRGACNQSSARDPVVNFDDETVRTALDGLREKKLTRVVHPSHGSRTTKYRQVADETLGLDPGELAVVSVLLLRGHQTAGELRSRSERQHAFADLDEVEATLARLADRGLVEHLERVPGQRDRRYAHLLGPGAAAAAGAPASPQSAPVPTSPADPGPPGNDDEVAGLRAEMADLRRMVDHLYDVLGESPPPNS